LNEKVTLSAEIAFVVEENNNKKAQGQEITPVFPVTEISRCLNCETSIIKIAR